MNRDIEPEVLEKLISQSDHKELLISLVDTSRKYIGWYTTQRSRSFEYPWIAAQLGNAAGKRIVDIGAGCSPLPLHLADAGAQVTTIDYSPAVPSKNIRSEWGFLNYKELNPSMTSINADATTVELKDIDVVYSVSAMEHMPATVRRAVIRRVSEWLKLGGLLLLTLDMAPGSDALWNRDRGKDVEDQNIHGNLDDVKAELSNAGLRVDECERKTYNVVMIRAVRV